MRTNQLSRVVVLAAAVALASTACNTAADKAEKTATTDKGATTTATTAAAPPDLQSLLPTPANTRRSKGPDTIADGGTHMHYQVDGTPGDVMGAYKSALSDNGWQVSTIVTSGGADGGGGATYTGTNGAAYGVFDGGGYQTNTFIDVCVWPTKPADPNCSRSDR